MRLKKTKPINPGTIPHGFKLRHTLRGHKGQIIRPAWSPDGKMIASPSTDKTVRIWDTLTGQLLRTLTGHYREIFCVAWSQNGGEFASGSFDMRIRVYDSNLSSSRVLEGHNGPIFSLAWSPNSQMLASGSSDNTVRIWYIHERKSPKVIECEEPIYCLKWAPDGSLLAVGEGRTIYIWNSLTGKFLKSFEGHVDTVFDIVWSQDGRKLASGSKDMTIRLWDVDDGHQEHVLKGHTASINSLSFSFDGQLLGSKSRDNTVRVWRCKSWEPVVIFGEGGELGVWLGGLAFHPNQPVLATLGENNTVIRIWDLDLDLIAHSAPAISLIRYTNAKVILVGETSTGKTCLARALMGLPFEPQESTHGMKVWTFHSEVTPKAGGEQVTRETNLWDLAGQTDYQVVHQLFLDETSLAIILFDPTHPENPFSGVEHWEKALRRVAGENCPQLLVAGRVDRGYPTATQRDIEIFRLEHGFSEFITTSAKTNLGMDELRSAILRSIPWNKLPVTTSPELWEEIREYLLKRRLDKNVLTRRSDLREAFRQTRPEKEFNDVDFDTVVSHSQSQGLVWRLSFGDFILLKPELLNDYASAVVRVARKHKEGLGCIAERDVLEGRIDFEDMERLIDSQTERSLVHAVVELFLDREVALREGEYIVFPSKFNRKRPEYPKPPLREVAYSFDGSVEDIYATLVVRLYYCGAFELKDLWKNAAEFRDPIGNVCGLLLSNLEEGRGILSIFFEPATSLDSKLLFLRFTHEHLRKRALRESVKRERIYRCEKCGNEIKDKEAIETRLKKGMETIPCLYCDNRIRLIDLLEEKFLASALLRQVQKLEEKADERKEHAVGVTMAKAKEDIGEYDVFLAHNSEDKLDVEGIGELLKQRGINPWLDKWNLPPGRMFQEEIERMLPSIKSVAVFVGAGGIGPWENMEIRAAITQFVKRKLPVIPVLLATISKPPELPLFLKEFKWVRFVKGIDDVEALDNLQWGITGQRPQGRLP